MPKNYKKPKMKQMPMPYREGEMEEYKMKPMPMPYIEDAMEEPRMKPMPYYEDDFEESMGQEAAQGAVGEALGRKKGGMVRGQGAAIRGTKFKGIF